MKNQISVLVLCVLLMLFMGACVPAADNPAELPEDNETEAAEEEAARTAVAETDISEALSEPADVMVVHEGESLRVLWTISDYVMNNAQKSDDEAARERLFMPLDMTEEEITFDGKVCTGVNFVEQTVNAEAYLVENYNVGLEALGIETPEDFQVIKTNCPLFGFEEFFRLSDGYLIVPFEDVFYFFAPEVNY